MASVQGRDQFAVGDAGGLQLLVTFVEQTLKVDEALLEVANASLELLAPV